MYETDLAAINFEIDGLASILKEALNELVGEDSIKSQDKLGDFITAELKTQNLSARTYHFAIDLYLSEVMNFELNIVNSRGETLISSSSEMINRLTFYDWPIECLSRSYALEQAKGVLWDLLENMAHPDDYFDMQLIAAHLPILDIAELKEAYFARLSAVYPTLNDGSGFTLEFETPFGIVILDHVNAEDIKDVETIIDNDLYEVVDIEKTCFGGYTFPKR